MSQETRVFGAVRSALTEAAETEQVAQTADKLLSATGLHSSAMGKLARMIVGEPPIESERLFVRKTTFDDADLFRRILANKNVSRYVGGPKNQEAIDSLLKYSVGAWNPKGFRRGIIVEKDSLRGVGLVNVGASVIPNEPGTEIGWAVTRGAQGKGYATELSGAMTDYAFVHLKSDRVLAWTHPENPASNRVLEKLNFKLLRLSEIPTKNEPHNLWELSAAAWRKSREA